MTTVVRSGSRSQPSRAHQLPDQRRHRYRTPIRASTVSPSGNAAPTAKLTADTSAVCNGRANPQMSTKLVADTAAQRIDRHEPHGHRFRQSRSRPAGCRSRL